MPHWGLSGAPAAIPASDRQHGPAQGGVDQCGTAVDTSARLARVAVPAAEVRAVAPHGTQIVSGSIPCPCTPQDGGGHCHHHVKVQRSKRQKLNMPCCKPEPCFLTSDGPRLAHACKEARAINPSSGLVPLSWHGQGSTAKTLHDRTATPNILAPCLHAHTEVSAVQKPCPLPQDGA